MFLVSVGVLAHLFGKLPYRELASEVAAAGFSHIQLALWKAVNDADFNKPGKLSPGLAMSMAEEFRKQGVTISILGCYLHFFDRNPERLRENIERFKELIRYAAVARLSNCGGRNRQLSRWFIYGAGLEGVKGND